MVFTIRNFIENAISSTFENLLDETKNNNGRKFEDILNDIYNRGCVHGNSIATMTCVVRQHKEVKKFPLRPLAEEDVSTEQVLRAEQRFIAAANTNSKARIPLKPNLATEIKISTSKEATSDYENRKTNNFSNSSDRQGRAKVESELVPRNASNLRPIIHSRQNINSSTSQQGLQPLKNDTSNSHPLQPFDTHGIKLNLPNSPNNPNTELKSNPISNFKKKPHVDKYIPPPPSKKRKQPSLSFPSSKQHRKLAEAEDPLSFAAVQSYTNYKGVTPVVDVEEDPLPISSSSNLKKSQQKKSSIVLIKSFQTMYSAELHLFDKTVHLGRFTSAMLAAMAHDRARIRLLGPRNCKPGDLNFDILNYAKDPLDTFHAFDSSLRKQLFGSQYPGLQTVDFGFLLLDKDGDHRHHHHHHNSSSSSNGHSNCAIVIAHLSERFGPGIHTPPVCRGVVCGVCANTASETHMVGFALPNSSSGLLDWGLRKLKGTIHPVGTDPSVLSALEKSSNHFFVVSPNDYIPTDQQLIKYFTNENQLECTHIR
mmetsp:Transcript_23662/g.32482  ORF Transcript_23662/g.32482 Transcript_23662/m.32482 type:complete len:538 (-) Transcript_23662:824-2437(-)